MVLLHHDASTASVNIPRDIFRAFLHPDTLFFMAFSTILSGDFLGSTIWTPTLAKEISNISGF